MNFESYIALISEWTKLVNDKGITLSDGSDVPPMFWKTFLGLARSVHAEMLNSTYKRKTFSRSLAKTIKYAKLLDENVFLEQVKEAIPEFEANKWK